VTDARLRPAFAHASEAELARILDCYEVSWESEPHTFPILFDGAGAVLESFSPDFYLPDLDLYIELTTLKQRLVRKKNRKLRRLRELYPGLRVKLLYARDFRALLLKYGRIALADALSGAEGQSTPPRRDALAAAATGRTAATGHPAATGHAAAETGTPSGRAAAASATAARSATAAPSAARARRARRSRAEARARAAARAITPAPGTEMTA
jgi:hypothetical protein